MIIVVFNYISKIRMNSLIFLRPTIKIVIIPILDMKDKAKALNRTINTKVSCT